MKDWVPFHRSLMSGSKKAWSRATRFILMELSLHARANRGVLRLPPEWETSKAIGELLGGNRREIRDALGTLAAPDADGVPTIEIVRNARVHTVSIPKWSEHVIDRRGTERKMTGPIRRSDDVQKNQEEQADDGLTRASVFTDTGVSPSSKNPQGAGRRPTDARVSAFPKKEPSNIVRLLETKDPYNTEQDNTGQIKTTAPRSAAPDVVDARVGTKRGTRLPDGWSPTPAGIASVVEEFALAEPFVARTLEEFRDYWRGVPGQKGTKLDWEATFRNRLRDAAGRARRQSGYTRAAPVQQPAPKGQECWQMPTIISYGGK